MPIDYRADKSLPIRNGDAVVSTGANQARSQAHQREEVVPLPSASYGAVFLSMADRFVLPPTGWNGWQ